VTIYDSAVATITAYKPEEPSQKALREAFLGFLAARPDACARACEPGHITASAIVLDAKGMMTLLTLHPRVGRWLQLGGHCEDTDASIVEAARREATEESGIPNLVIDPIPLRLDVHAITCSLGVPTRHFDVQFLATAPEKAKAVISSESLDLQWWPVCALPDNVDSVPELARLAIARLR
jgi:8-oxo-dGTP pyrophosphatase MutT (NUDIX family)